MANSESGGKNVLCFSKYQGAGDHFVFVNNTAGKFPFLTDNQPLISRLLDQNFGIGGNALIELLPCPGYDYYMNYYNMDGTRGGLCGNGSRCSVIFANKENILSKKQQCYFKAIDGLHTAKIIESNPLKGLVEVNMDYTAQVQVEKLSDTDYFMDVGTPHYVRFVEDIAKYPVLTVGPTIIKLKQYQAIGGINANFAEMGGRNVGTRRLHLRTFERGAKHEILSCGTAAIVAAIVAYWREFHGRNNNQSMQYNNKEKTSPVQIDVVMAGGSLFVAFCVDQKCRFSDIWLRGPACEVFTGQVVVE